MVEAFPHPSTQTDGDAGPFERTYRAIMRGLYEGRFVPGQRLVAPDLMRQFGVGRGTIREVLNRLTASGVVSIEHNRGAQVRMLTRREVGEILDIVEVLLGLAARGAAAHIDEADARNRLIDRHQSLVATATRDFFAFLEAREDYYRFIVRLSRSRELQRLFPGAQVHIMRGQLRAYDRAGDSHNPDDFTDLTQAILSGDPQAAEIAGRQHVRITRDRVANLPASAFAIEPESGA